MNLARVLRRVTLVVSLGLLVLGALIVGLVWWEEKNTWSEATHSRSYDHAEVYVMNLGVVRFPRGSTDQQIKDELDRSAPSAIQKAMTRGTLLRSFREANPHSVNLTDSQLASNILNSDPLKWSGVSDIVIAEGVQITLLPVVAPTVFHLGWGDLISHLYVASSPSQSSTFYTRGQAIVAAASSEGNARLVLQDLATYYDSPRAHAAPFALLRAMALVAFGAVALPWGLFFFLRWVARGFSSTLNLGDAMKTEHVCPKCESKEIVRVGRSGDLLDRLVLEVRRKRPYRCFDCDHHFLDRPMSKQ
jgi:hypothetical protein